MLYCTKLYAILCSVRVSLKSGGGNPELWFSLFSVRQGSVRTRLGVVFLNSRFQCFVYARVPYGRLRSESQGPVRTDAFGP